MNVSMKGVRRKAFRRWLRECTHWRNQTEFFVAMVFECGVPPYPITQEYINWKRVTATNFGSDTGDAWTLMADWRDKCSTFISVNTHHSIDPTHLTQEYLKWLLQQQESRSMSRL